MAGDALGVEPTELPEHILTTAGWMLLDDEYVPRVVAGEHLHAHPEAKAALAIAARTFVLRAMRDRPMLGRWTPIPSGENFQVCAHGATPECLDAAARTRGIVLRYRGRMILANHVAGAPRRADGGLGTDAAKTERWVTYNIGRTGSDVMPTGLALRSHPGNRGCLGQNCSDWLASQGYDYPTILRFFYGEDIELHRREEPHTGRGSETSMLGVLALVALGMIVRR